MCVHEKRKSGGGEWWQGDCFLSRRDFKMVSMYCCSDITYTSHLWCLALVSIVLLLESFDLLGLQLRFDYLRKLMAKVAKIFSKWAEVSLLTSQMRPCWLLMFWSTVTHWNHFKLFRCFWAQHADRWNGHKPSFTKLLHVTCKYLPFYDRFAIVCSLIVRSRPRRSYAKPPSPLIH